MIYRLAALAISLAALTMLSPDESRAAAFNCNYAKLPAEVAICNDPTLSSYDEELSATYYRLINAAPNWARKKIKAEQVRWLGRRNACGYDMQCILGKYRWRMQQLGEWQYSLGL